MRKPLPSGYHVVIETLGLNKDQFESLLNANPQNEELFSDFAELIGGSADYRRDPELYSIYLELKKELEEEIQRVIKERY